MGLLLVLHLGGVEELIHQLVPVAWTDAGKHGAVGPDRLWFSPYRVRCWCSIETPLYLISSRVNLVAYVRRELVNLRTYLANLVAYIPWSLLQHCLTWLLLLLWLLHRLLLLWLLLL